MNINAPVIHILFVLLYHLKDEEYNIMIFRICYAHITQLISFASVMLLSMHIIDSSVICKLTYCKECMGKYYY